MFGEFDTLILHNIARFTDITGYISLIESCRYLYDCLNISGNIDLYRDIFDNSAVISHEYNADGSLKRTMSYIMYKDTKILHGLTLMYANNNVVVRALYYKNKPMKRISYDSYGNIKYICKDINGIEYAIKIKYVAVQFAEIVCNGIKWLLELNEDLKPLKYVTKVGNTKYITYYRPIGDFAQMIAINIFGDLMHYHLPTPDIEQAMQIEPTLRPIIQNIIKAEMIWVDYINRRINSVPNQCKRNDYEYYDYNGELKYKVNNNIVYKYSKNILYKTIDGNDTGNILTTYYNKAQKTKRVIPGRSLNSVETAEYNGYKFKRVCNGWDYYISYTIGHEVFTHTVISENPPTTHTWSKHYTHDDTQQIITWDEYTNAIQGTFEL